MDIIASLCSYKQLALRAIGVPVTEFTLHKAVSCSPPEHTPAHPSLCLRSPVLMLRLQAGTRPFSRHRLPGVPPFLLCRSGGSVPPPCHAPTPTWSPCCGRISETLSYWRRSSAHSASSRPCGDTVGSVREQQHTLPTRGLPGGTPSTWSASMELRFPGAR